MSQRVLIAHAKSEEGFVEQLAVPIREAGYDVSHTGTVLVGESIVDETARILGEGGPVVLCGTQRAAGNTWVKRLVSAARQINKGMLFIVQMEEEADLEAFAFGERIAAFWKSPNQAVDELIAALNRHYPTSGSRSLGARKNHAEQHYRDILLETCDIINLANLPEQDRHIAQKQQDLKLRGLYIPLRVQVETSINKESSETDKEDAPWEELEARRVASRYGKPGIRSPNGERPRVPVGERLSQSMRLVILGDPGAGKTTLTRWVATAYLLRLKRDKHWKELPDVKSLPDADLLPIIVRCRDLDLNSLTGSLDDILKHVLRKSELPEEEAGDLRKQLQTKISKGQALLMLDGLDEITDPAARTTFCQQLEQIVVAYPKTPIIATSRIVGYREMGYKIGRGFEHVTLAELIPEEKDEFARRWCMLTEVPERRETATNELIHDIHSAERIERLTGNPMLLTTMALVKRKVGKLPNRRAELYWEAVQVLLNWRREVDEPIDVREAIPQLEFVAYAMCDLGVQQLRRDEILELFARMRDEYPNVHPARNRAPEEFLSRLEARTGILVEAGHIRHLGMLVPVYEFRHLTFQEYLAARALVDGRFPGRDPKQSLGAQVAPLAGRTAETSLDEFGPKEASVLESWREALRLCANICSDDDVDSVLRAILTPQENETPSIARARAILGALCLVDEPNASLKVAREILYALSKHVGNEDGSGNVRTGLDAVAIALGGTRWSGVLTEALTSDFVQREPENHENSAGVLGMTVGETVLQDENRLNTWFVEKSRSLRTMSETEAIAVALGIMHLAFKQKAQLVPGLVPGLLNRLSGTKPMMHSAAWALGWLAGGHLQKGIWRASPSQIKTLLAFVKNPNADSCAVCYLTWLFIAQRETRAAEPLSIWLNNDVAAVRKTIARALGSLKNAAVTPSLIAYVNDNDENVRNAVAWALGELGSETAITALTQLLNDPNESVRRDSMIALGKINNAEAVATLSRLLDHTDSDVRCLAVESLSQELDQTDRILLTRDLDGLGPFIDPQDTIDQAIVKTAASKIKRSLARVRSRYEALASRFQLRLTWKPSEAPP